MTVPRAPYAFVQTQGGRAPAARPRVRDPVIELPDTGARSRTRCGRCAPCSSSGSRATASSAMRRTTTMSSMSVKPRARLGSYDRDRRAPPATERARWCISLGSRTRTFRTWRPSSKPRAPSQRAPTPHAAPRFSRDATRADVESFARVRKKVRGLHRRIRDEPSRPGQRSARKAPLASDAVPV